MRKDGMEKMSIQISPEMKQKLREVKRDTGMGYNEAIRRALIEKYPDVKDKCSCGGDLAYTKIMLPDNTSGYGHVCCKCLQLK